MRCSNIEWSRDLERTQARERVPSLHACRTMAYPRVLQVGGFREKKSRVGFALGSQPTPLCTQTLHGHILWLAPGNRINREKGCLQLRSRQMRCDAAGIRPIG